MVNKRRPIPRGKKGEGRKGWRETEGKEGKKGVDEGRREEDQRSSGRVLVWSMRRRGHSGHAGLFAGKAFKVTSRAPIGPSLGPHTLLTQTVGPIRRGVCGLRLEKEPRSKSLERGNQQRVDDGRSRPFC